MDRGTLPHWLRVALHTAPQTAGAELALTQKPIHHVIYLTTLPNRKQAWGKAWLTLGLATDGWQSIRFLSLGSGLLPPEQLKLLPSQTFDDSALTLIHGNTVSGTY